MNNQEAKFILGAYRPDGRDAGDPAFAEAKAQAERDPELRGWWERQRKFDATVSAKLQSVMPPAGLRESILAGVRASQPRRNWWIHPGWLAAAAALVVLGAVTLALRNSTGSPSAQQLAQFALRDLANSHNEHTGHPDNLDNVQAQLVGANVPLTRSGIDLDELKRKHCRSIRVGGREVFEICFQRDGTWYHLYAAKRDDFAPGNIDPRSLMQSQGEFASTVWADSKNVYALVTAAGVEALRRLI